ncbi:hypothetical protein [Lentzea sp. NPDC003310]|uniref:hypothetical protein n=1 Tax=Lentzea sp. NPDC003310 TaxID=3154447 RepID=UPI0033BC2B6B
MLKTPYTIWDGDDVHGRRPVVTGVAVDLDRLFARAPGATRHVIATGLDLTGTAVGQLHGRFPGVEGDWLGVVNYEIGYADGRQNKLRVVDQLVPFHVLRQI